MDNEKKKTYDALVSAAVALNKALAEFTNALRKNAQLQSGISEKDDKGEAEYSVSEISFSSIDRCLSGDQTSSDEVRYESFNSHVADLKNWAECSPDKKLYIGDEIFLNLGSPRGRLMHPLVLAPDSRENLLLLSNPEETACTASILLSCLRSFELFGGKSHILTHERNRIFRQFKNVWDQYLPASDTGMIRAEIRSIASRVRSQIPGNDFIVLLGVDRIYEELEIADEKKANEPISEHKALNIRELISSGAMTIRNPEEPDTLTKLRALGIMDEFPEEDYSGSKENGNLVVGKKKADINEWRRTGAIKERNTGEPDTLSKWIAMGIIEGFPEQDYSLEEVKRMIPVGGREKTMDSVCLSREAFLAGEENDTMSYNSVEDLKYIICRGSRFGYHVVAVSDSYYEDFRRTRIPVEMFRHRLSFRSSRDDSYIMFGNPSAEKLPKHEFLYSDHFSSFSFRPYQHLEISLE